MRGVPALAFASAMLVGLGSLSAQEASSTGDNEATATPTLEVSIPFMSDETVTYRGVVVHVDFWVPVPEQWDLTSPALLELKFSHSPVLIERLSSMTASLNDNGIDSVFLNVQNARDGKVVWQIDPSYIKRGEMNKLNITAKMRSDLELCDDVHSPALWMTIDGESRLVIRYHERPVTLDVSRFPDTYLRPDIYYGDQTQERTHAIMVVPTDASPEVLNGIGIVSARFGVDTRLPRGKLEVWSIDTLTEDTISRLKDHNLIIVGHESFVQKFAAAGLDVTDILGTPQGDGRGWVVEAHNPWNTARRALVVTGRDDAALAKATGALSLPHLSEQWAVRKGEPTRRAVSFIDSPEIPAATGDTSSGTVTVSLADLGSTDITELGKFHHYVRLSFPNPYVGRIKSPAFIRLDLSHSELLVPQTSSLLVKINGEPVRSVRLAPRTARKLQADILIPSKFFGDRVIVADLEFFLDIGDPDCHYNFPEMAWATVFNTSFIAFPLSDSPTTSLRSYPWVVAKEANLNGLTFVISDTATDEDLTAVANTAAFLGKALPRFRDEAGQPMSQWVHPWVKRVSALTEADTTNNDLVAIGDYDFVRARKDIAGAVPDTLFAATPTGDNLKTYTGSSYRSEAGWIHLAESPWNPRRNLLVVSGAQGAPAISSAAEYLWVQRKADRLGGSTVLVGPNGSIQVLIVAAGEEARAAPAGPLVPRIPATNRAADGDISIDSVGQPKHQKSATTVPNALSAEPTARHQVAYLVFVILGLLLVVLVVVRVRDAMRSGN